MKLFFAILFSIVAGTSLALPLNKVVVFGDSLSDNGNLYEYMHHEIPQSPPYFEGRFSNGLIWVERLVAFYYPDKLKEHLFNYAFGGASIAEDTDDEVLFTLKKEMDTYFLAHHDIAEESSLYVVWIGANNYLGAMDKAEKTPQEVNDGITKELKRLAQAGAKHIMVINLPNLGNTPLARAIGVEEKLSYLTSRHNIVLQNNIDNLQHTYPDVQWLYFDVSQTVEDIITDPEKYGFTNITDMCNPVRLEGPPSKKTLLQLASKAKSIEGDCEGFLFFDLIHPTALAHQIMADRAQAFLDNAGIEFE